jgi:hypothetical protein
MTNSVLQTTTSYLVLTMAPSVDSRLSEIALLGRRSRRFGSVSDAGGAETAHCHLIKSVRLLQVVSVLNS